MISDLLALEQYFDRESAALSMQDLMKYYDEPQINEALSKGYLKTKSFCVCDKTKPCMCWLSEKGRCIALSRLN